LAYFKDDQEVYQYIGKLFVDLADDDVLGPKFRKADTIVQYHYSNPESTITVKMKDGEDGQVDFGDTSMDPEIVMSMEADTAHKFWLGKVNVTMALAKGQMKAKGPVQGDARAERQRRPAAGSRLRGRYTREEKQ
jgi:hypothetical protein